MPILIQKNISPNILLGIWHITETIDEFLSMKKWSIDDICAIEKFSREHRKKEWLTARILTEKLSKQEEVKFFYDEHNKPFLKNSNWHISISHSRNLLAVILSKESETGIDIELVKPQIFRIKEKFMSDDELKSIGEKNAEEQLTVFWCAKESLYKLYGKKKLTFKKNILIEPFVYADEGMLVGKISNSSIEESFNLKYEKIIQENNSYMLAYIIKKVNE